MPNTLRWILAAAGYLTLAVAVSWPLALRLGDALPGYPNVDALDTVTLRGLAADLIAAGWPERSDGIYAPYGYPVGQMIPNWADHLLGALLLKIWSFPTADGLWWLLILTLNGLAGHRLGHQLGGSHGAGAVVGAGWALSDAMLREVNLSHAPQSMAFSTPLYLAALWRATGEEGRARDGIAAGVWMSVAGLTYWYGALFLAAASVPVALARRGRAAWARIGLAAAVALALTGPPMARTLDQWGELPQPALPAGSGESEGPRAFVPPSEVMEVDQGRDPLFPLQPIPLDTSNLASIALLLGIGAAAWRRRWGRAELAALLAIATLGYVMALGPYLKWEDEVVVAGGGLVPLPFHWLGELHPGLNRLNWPPRWGILMALGLAAAAARSPRPWWLAAAALIELGLRSQNAPLQLHDLRHREPWADLSVADGAVLELPLVRGLRASEVGVNARYHGRPLVNPILLPPGHRAPEAWQRWTKEQPLVAAILRMEIGEPVDGPSGEAARAAGAELREAGIGAVALRFGPGSGISRGDVVRYHALLDPALGRPEDRGAYLVWWAAPPTEDAPPSVEEPEAWREELGRRLADEPPPALHTRIDIAWPGVRPEQGRKRSGRAPNLQRPSEPDASPGGAPRRARPGGDVPERDRPPGADRGDEIE